MQIINVNTEICLFCIILSGTKSSFSNYYKLSDLEKRLSLQWLTANCLMEMAFCLDSFPVFPVSGNRQTTTCSATVACIFGRNGSVVLLPNMTILF